MARTEPQINIRLPKDLKEAVQDMASDNKRSVNAEIVSVLLEAVRRHKHGDTPYSSGTLLWSHQFASQNEVIEEIAMRAAKNAVDLANKNNEKK